MDIIWILLIVLLIVLLLLITVIILWARSARELIDKIENLKATFDQKLVAFYHNHAQPLTYITAENQNIQWYTWNLYKAALQELLAISGKVEELHTKLSKINSRPIYRNLVSTLTSLSTSTPALGRTRFCNHCTNILSEVKNTVAAFDRQTQIIADISPSQMVDPDNYGQVNKAFWASVQDMSRHEADSVVQEFTQAIEDNRTYWKCLNLDPKKMLQTVWFFACEKPYSVAAFNKSCELFKFIFKEKHSDLEIAGLYAKKQIGGEEAIRDTIRFTLQGFNHANALTLLASGLMWMNAYHQENVVLQHMLSKGFEMTEKTQQRLHSLTNGGGKSPVGYEAESSEHSLYFDVSALAWKEDEYVGLFENLAFQDKILTYSLAIRDEDKDLFIAHSITVPSSDVVLAKFKKVFADEYDSGVHAATTLCTALSGSGAERMEGILVSSDEYKQLGIFILIARIGRKLIVKFYTLFMPVGSDLSTQKQQALSMFNKLSPNVTMLENSLKATMLMAVEQLLNTTSQSNPNSSDDSFVGSEDPIF